jgi:diadenylate cyclase
MALLRGVLFLVVFIIFLTSLLNLPAFSWLINTTLPALLLAIPVIFAPEIRRTLERIGRAGAIYPTSSQNTETKIEAMIESIISATARLSARQHGALIVLQRLDNLEAFISTGVRMDTTISPEILLQIFYPNTPLHDGAVIISDFEIAAASCIMPLSSSGILARSPEREMGLRHRAALGTSEVSDSLALVVSEENGDISIAQSGRIIRQLSPERLKNILLAFYRPTGLNRSVGILERYLPFLFRRKEE